KMHGDGATTLGRAPGNRLGKRVVDFEGARRMAKAIRRTPKSRRHAAAGHPGECLWREVAEDQRTFVRQFLKFVCADAPRGPNCAPARCKTSDERIGNGACSASGNRPAYRVSRRAKHYRNGRTERLVEAQERVAGKPRE